MEAWKIKYYQTDKPENRWTACILALSKEDALRHLSAVLKFAYAIESCEFIGPIHAITEQVLVRIAQARQNTAVAASKSQPEQKTPIAKQSIETDVNNTEIECKYCGKVCKDQAGLTNHEQKCKKNPEYAKLERERQKKRQQKLEKPEKPTTPEDDKILSELMEM